MLRSSSSIGAPVLWVLCTLAASLATSACGTFSVMRPADNLKAGQVEISGGLTVNSLPDANPVLQANVGVLDWLELGAQYETYSAEGWLRFAPLSTDDNGLALALSLGAGGLNTIGWSSDEHSLDDSWTPTLMGGATLGRRFADWFEPYIGVRLFYLASSEIALTTVKGGMRFTPARWSWGAFWLGLEGGATFYDGLFAVGEGTAALGFIFGSM